MIDEKTKNNIKTDVARLAVFMADREPKYIRSYNRYYTNGPVEDSIGNIRPLPPAYTPQTTEYGVKTKLNVQKSIIDTVDSKLSQLKVRPYFNPVDGDHETTKICRQAQLFFDHFYSAKKVHQTIALATRDALIFDMGACWVDELDGEIKRVKPWGVFLDPAEFDAGEMSRICITFKGFPIIAIINKIKKYKGGKIAENKLKEFIKELTEEAEADRTATHEYTIYYDLFNKKRYDIYKNIFFNVTDLNSDTCPVSFIYYNKPIKGFFSNSIIDDTYGLQYQIDEMGDRVDAATRLAPTAFIVYDDTQDAAVQMSKFSNEPFIKVKFKSSLGGQPPQIVTPPPISPAFQSIIDAAEAKMFQTVGVSQLSAQSKKPGGVTSGVALQTLEDVESDRFNVLVNNVIEIYVELAQKMIACFPDDDEILPKTLLRRDAVKWSQVKKHVDLYQIQFSATSTLSKDPATKLEQINQLINSGFISHETAAKFLEMPDLEKAFEDTTSVVDYADYLINRAIETGATDFYEVINLDFLFSRIITTFCRLATTKDTKAIENLKKFLEEVDAKRQELAAAAAPPGDPIPPAEGEPMPPEGDPMAAPIEPLEPIQEPI